MFSWLKWRRRRSVSGTARKLPIDPAFFKEEGANLYAALSAFWDSSDPNTYSHNGTKSDIEAIEEKYSLQLPEEFRNYLMHAAPGVRFMDDFGIQWWSPSDIKTISDECPDGPPGQINPDIEQEKDTYLVFADYLLWCYAWAICCSDGPNRGKVALIGGLPDTFVANNFRNFIRLVLTDDVVIHQGQSRQ